jgi:hypothetical protein
MCYFASIYMQQTQIIALVSRTAFVSLLFCPVRSKPCAAMRCSFLALLAVVSRGCLLSFMFPQQPDIVATHLLLSSLPVSFRFEPPIAFCL